MTERKATCRLRQKALSEDNIVIPVCLCELLCYYIPFLSWGGNIL
jgi:hypothetical protein